MPRVPRERGWDIPSTGGYYNIQFPSGSTTNYNCHPVTTNYRNMKDWVGQPFIDSPLYSEKGFCTAPRLSGSRNYLGTQYDASDVLCTGAVATTLSRIGPWLNSSIKPAMGVLHSAAIANANPNKPIVDLPVILGELGELPKLLRQAGRDRISAGNIESRVAQGNLAYEFGLRPLLGDLQAMLGISRSMQNRARYLSRLSSGWTKVQRNLGNQSYSQTKLFSPGFQAPYPLQRGIKVTGEVNASQWYSLRARLDETMSYGQIKSAVPDIAFGTSDINLAQAWELLPWSWLIDWFSNVGDLMASSRGNIRWTYKDLNLMAKVDVKTSCTFYRSYYTEGQEQYTQVNEESGRVTLKTRGVRTIPTLEIFSPILDSRQVGILASLATLRR